MVGEGEVFIDIRERVVRIETLLENQEKISASVAELDERTQEQGKKLVEVEDRSKSNTHRIDKLEENNTWIWRTIAGAVIVAAVGAIIVIH